MGIAEIIQAAGIVGAGGAGFPTHVKLSAKADCFIINAAECEPLIETDKYITRTFASEIVNAAARIAEHLGASRTVIALKKKYKAEISALAGAIACSGKNIEVFELDSFYPSGDEQVLVQMITGKTVPERGIPLNVGTVVDNVGTMLNIFEALQNKPVTEKYLSIVGEVPEPLMLKVPIGISVRRCIEAAGSLTSEYDIIVGGPMMGKFYSDPDTIARLSVTKTMGNLIVLPKGHYLGQRAEMPLGRIKVQAKSACVQCRMCTSICPRYLIGHQMRPHQVMRALFREDLVRDPEEYTKLYGDAANCSECGLCEMFACPMGLSPRKVNIYIKGQLRDKGIQVPKKSNTPIARDGIFFGRVPTDRLIARLSLSKYNHRHATSCITLEPDEVHIPFRQHIGKPAEPVKQTGDRIKKGDLLAKPAEGLSAGVHASIEGVVTQINENGATIVREGAAR